MSDIKSYQRLLAVQALYEFTINKKDIDDSFDEMLLHIVKNSDFKNILELIFISHNYWN